LPDVPEPTPGEIAFLLDAVGGLLDTGLGPGDVLGAFAGLRPLLRDGSASRSTADLSRRHAVLTSPDGVVTVVGGKLTTYRAMARDAVDAALAGRPQPGRPQPGLHCPRSQTRRLPLVGAASPQALAKVAAPARLVARYGTEAPEVLALARRDPRLAEPVAEGVPVTGAELAFAVRHEAALDAGDLLDRRTRIGLVPADRDRALPAATRALGALATGT
jgi:glycerol-3-phosphate dehydrogenase